MKDLAGKGAVITGGVSGIGLAIARELVVAGARVVITYRREDHLRQAMALFGDAPAGAVHPVRMDVTDRDSVRHAADEAGRVLGKVHILCNNAGVNLIGAMDEATFDDWDWILGVNLHGVVNGLVTFLPRIKAHGEGGHIVNVASMSSFISGPAAGVYSTSKFAVRGLSESLRYALAPHGIGVSMVCPGLTRSNIFESARYRPETLGHTAFPLDDATLKRMQDIHALGMEAEEVGRRTIEGIKRNDFYIFSHPEFRDEVRELCDEILAAFPQEAVEAKRLVVEVMRRRAKEQARQALARL